MSPQIETGAILSSTVMVDQHELPPQLSINFAITLVPACSAVRVAFGIGLPCASVSITTYGDNGFRLPAAIIDGVITTEQLPSKDTLKSPIQAIALLSGSPIATVNSEGAIQPGVAATVTVCAPIAKPVQS